MLFVDLVLQHLPIYYSHASQIGNIMFLLISCIVAIIFKNLSSIKQFGGI